MMGMYDTIEYKTECPHCKAEIKSFQSKDASCTMDTLPPTAVNNFYSSCRECESWIEFYRVPEDTGMYKRIYWPGASCYSDVAPKGQDDPLIQIDTGKDDASRQESLDCKECVATKSQLKKQIEAREVLLNTVKLYSNGQICACIAERRAKCAWCIHNEALTQHDKILGEDNNE